MRGHYRPGEGGGELLQIAGRTIERGGKVPGALAPNVAGAELALSVPGAGISTVRWVIRRPARLRRADGHFADQAVETLKIDRGPTCADPRECLPREPRTRLLRERHAAPWNRDISATRSASFVLASAAKAPGDVKELAVPV